jgi:soluble lytic murein transglycosylase-like protein
MIAASLAIAGCGSSSKTEPGESAFVSNANTACRTAYTRAQAIKKPTSAAEVPAYVAQLKPIAHELLEKLTALSPPAAKQAEYTKMLALWRQEISLADARSAALKSGDERHSETLDEEGHNTDTQFDHAATTLGLTVCASNL